MEKRSFKRLFAISSMLSLFFFLSMVLGLTLFMMVFIIVFDYASAKENATPFLDVLIKNLSQSVVQIKHEAIPFLSGNPHLAVLIALIFLAIFVDTFFRVRREYQLFDPDCHGVKLEDSAVGFLTCSREFLAGIDHMMAQLSAKNKKKEIEKFIQLKAFVSSAIDEAKNIQPDDIKTVFNSKREAIAQFYTEDIHREIMRSQATYLMHTFILNLVIEYARLNKLISVEEKKNDHLLFMSFMYQTTDILSLNNEEKKVVYSMIDFYQNKRATVTEKLIRKYHL